MFKSILFFLLLLTNFNLILRVNGNAIAQNPPAETFQEGFWQPVARVDLDKPIKLYINNVTNIPISQTNSQ